MSNNKLYLCGGTFFAQITVNKSKKINELLIMKKLLNVYFINEDENDPPYVDIFKSDVSNFKSCKIEAPESFKFNDIDVKKRFDTAVKTSDTNILKIIDDLSDKLFGKHTEKDSKTKRLRLISSILYIIKNDDRINPNDEFYVESDGIPLNKKNLLEISAFNFNCFLLGIWHYIIMHRYNSNKEGRLTYESWIVDDENHVSQSRYTFSESIYTGIEKNISIITNEPDDTQVDIQDTFTQTKECRYKEQFKIDFYDILKYLINKDFRSKTYSKIFSDEKYQAIIKKWNPAPDYFNKRSDSSINLDNTKPLIKNQEDYNFIIKAEKIIDLIFTLQIYTTHKKYRSQNNDIQKAYGQIKNSQAQILDDLKLDDEISKIVNELSTEFSLLYR